ncbi:MAG: HipA domain-containing protein [Burkholderiales bacterium]|nr:HipA domain-containing protein [Burkholderiales bacterium]
MATSDLNNRDLLTILGALNARGLASSADLQAATGKSQATVSRLLQELQSQVLSLGQGRSRLYGMGANIRGQSAQQPVFWVDETGLMSEVGRLSLLANQNLHLRIGRQTWVTPKALPWILTPLRAQGFLGRLIAQQLLSNGLEPDPDRWGLESILFAALHTPDAPGALILGEPTQRPVGPILPSKLADKLAALDQASQDVAQTLPAGSSAGGEQPKFLAHTEDGSAVLVKFTPPRGTPFGERWHDLLHTEAVALSTLQDHGVPCAKTEIVSSGTRTYLISERFDRIGPHGRRHVVPVGAAHDGFVANAYQSWAPTCQHLAEQKQLSRADADLAQTLQHFGRLIGNTDMHSGNLSLYVDQTKLAKPIFTLAPVYDMLSMRWRPDIGLGAPDYSAFELNPLSLQNPIATSWAATFWQRLANTRHVSADMQEVASVMWQRCHR